MRDPQQQEHRLHTYVKAVSRLSLSPCLPFCTQLLCLTVAHREDLCMSPKVEQLKDEVRVHPPWHQLGAPADINPRAPVSRSSRPAPWPA